MMNQVTYMDTISRPYTSNSMYSMISKKKNISPEELQSRLPLLNVISESRYGEFLDSNVNQGGSQWHITPTKKIVSASHSKDNLEYVAKVEQLKSEMHNMRAKALKYIVDRELVDPNEERRPSRFHLKCPI